MGTTNRGESHQATVVVYETFDGLVRLPRGAQHVPPVLRQGYDQVLAGRAGGVQLFDFGIQGRRLRECVGHRKEAQNIYVNVAEERRGIGG